MEIGDLVILYTPLRYPALLTRVIWTSVCKETDVWWEALIDGQFTEVHYTQVREVVNTSK